MMPRDALGCALYGRENWESMQPGQVFSHTDDGYVDRVLAGLAEQGFSVAETSGVEYAPCYATHAGEVFPLDTATAVRRFAESDVIRMQREENREMGAAADKFFVGVRDRTKWTVAGKWVSTSRELPEED